jgi:hypothetical protein
MVFLLLLNMIGKAIPSTTDRYQSKTLKPTDPNKKPERHSDDEGLHLYLAHQQERNPGVSTTGFKVSAYSDFWNLSSRQS